MIWKMWTSRMIWNDSQNFAEKMNPMPSPLIGLSIIKSKKDNGDYQKPHSECRLFGESFYGWKSILLQWYYYLSLTTKILFILETSIKRIYGQGNGLCFLITVRMCSNPLSPIALSTNKERKTTKQEISKLSNTGNTNFNAFAIITQPSLVIQLSTLITNTVVYETNSTSLDYLSLSHFQIHQRGIEYLYLRVVCLWLISLIKWITR